MNDISTIPASVITPFQSRIEGLFDKMDKAYEAVANRCGFVCEGCEDNCCLTRFYHHTLLEYLYLRQGFFTLTETCQKEAKKNAEAVIAIYAADDTAVRAICPLNTSGRCILYAYRPMICRLHGIPNEMKRPDGVLVRGPGCHEFGKHFPDPPAVFLDRTPHYREMASIESNLRITTGFSLKIKLTIAEMIRHFTGGHP